MIIGCQIRAARALINMSQDELAEAAGLTPQAIRKIESGSVTPREGTIGDLEKAFNSRGVEFIDDQGVRFKPIGIEIFDGRERFNDFLNFMYNYLECFGGDVFININDERALQDSIKDIGFYRSKMLDFVNSGKVKGRILAAEGNFIHTWADLRRQPKVDGTPQVSFFAFGDNLALISFDHKNPPYVVVHKSGPFAAAYKTAFDIIWEKAEVIHV